MARATLTTVADEGSTYIVRATYYDEDDTAVTPDSVTWSLVDGDGHIVNSREDVSIAVPSTYNDIVLGAADLRCKGTRDASRTMIVKYVYDSATVTNAPGIAQVSFQVHNMQNVVGR
jgi:hypothetical protein